MLIIMDFLEAEVANLADDLKDSDTAKGQRATGDWMDSVEVRRDSTSVSIWANDYTQWLVQGRAPGKKPPIDPLIRWVEAKLGVQGNEAKGIAFAVATKIANEGTNYYPEGTDLIDGVLTEKRYTEINERIGSEVSLFIARELARQFKEAFA